MAILATTLTFGAGNSQDSNLIIENRVQQIWNQIQKQQKTVEKNVTVAADKNASSFVIYKYPEFKAPDTSKVKKALSLNVAPVKIPALLAEIAKKRALVSLMKNFELYSLNIAAIQSIKAGDIIDEKISDAKVFTAKLKWSQFLVDFESFSGFEAPYICKSLDEKTPIACEEEIFSDYRLGALFSDEEKNARKNAADKAAKKSELERDIETFKKSLKRAEEALKKL